MASVIVTAVQVTAELVAVVVQVPAKTGNNEAALILKLPLEVAFQALSNVLSLPLTLVNVTVNFFAKPLAVVAVPADVAVLALPFNSAVIVAGNVIVTLLLKLVPAVVVECLLFPVPES
jgi:hypothetical protein